VCLLYRFNPKTRNVELKASQHTEEASAVQRAADFVQAFMLGFEIQDAVALLRLEDLYVDSFEVRSLYSSTDLKIMCIVALSSL
jgi:RNA-binding protein PNO1